MSILSTLNNAFLLWFRDAYGRPTYRVQLPTPRRWRTPFGSQVTLHLALFFFVSSPVTLVQVGRSPRLMQKMQTIKHVSQFFTQYNTMCHAWRPCIVCFQLKNHHLTYGGIVYGYINEDKFLTHKRLFRISNPQSTMAFTLPSKSPWLSSVHPDGAIPVTPAFRFRSLRWERIRWKSKSLTVWPCVFSGAWWLVGF